jgi:hypothetical protein
MVDEKEKEVTQEEEKEEIAEEVEVKGEKEEEIAEKVEIKEEKKEETAEKVEAKAEKKEEIAEKVEAKEEKEEEIAEKVEVKAEKKEETAEKVEAKEEKKEEIAEKVEAKEEKEEEIAEKAEPEEIEKPLDKMTAKDLREIAKEIPGVTGVHAMKKDQLLEVIKQARGIKEEEPVKEKKKKAPEKAIGVRELKQKIVYLKQEKEAARAARDRGKVDILRRRINRLKKRSRKAAQA